EGFEPQRVILGDLDGDGLDDLAFVESGRLTLWINQGGNRWSDPVVLDGTPPVADLAAVRLTDLLGVGTAGILWTEDQIGPGTAHHVLDLTGGVKPYLL